MFVESKPDNSHAAVDMNFFTESIWNYKLNIYNYKLIIWNYKLRVYNYKLNIWNYKFLFTITI